MKAIDRYHKWVEWSSEDETYIGRCPDVVPGIRGDYPLFVYQELCDVVQEVLTFLEANGKPDAIDLDKAYARDLIIICNHLHPKLIDRQLTDEDNEPFLPFRPTVSFQ